MSHSQLQESVKKIGKKKQGPSVASLQALGAPSGPDGRLAAAPELSALLSQFFAGLFPLRSVALHEALASY